MTWAARQRAREVLEVFVEAAQFTKSPRARFEWWWRGETTSQRWNREHPDELREARKRYKQRNPDAQRKLRDRLRREDPAAYEALKRRSTEAQARWRAKVRERASALSSCPSEQ